MPRRSILVFAGACVAIAAALAVVTMVVVGRQAPTPQSLEVGSTGQAQVGGPFQLVNQDGQPVDQTILNGKWTLVFFGFTYCPDYCPTTLTMLEATKARLGDKAKNLQIVFISVDPERDTPQALKDYLSADGFPEGVVGLTGTPQQVRAAADAYRAMYSKVGEGEGYTMSHSLVIYLMGPDGRFRGSLAHDIGPVRGAEIIERHMARG
ncbi:SCO family protein [Brevundimonas sp.]|uniref:SCO family protein n=1 Tax=Brevundimonas sp. TaxID=1871086 RepID=UPI0025C300A2|nr:SCO family protein [Brevundimonas sp.]